MPVQYIMKYRYMSKFKLSQYIMKEGESHRRNAARIMNGGGNEKLALSINNQRATIVGYI